MAQLRRASSPFNRKGEDKQGLIEMAVVKLGGFAEGFGDDAVSDVESV